MSLRVIAGSAKGCRLKTLPGNATRPVTDRVKENLFNILGADVRGSRWWDIFGGTGAVGIEALSRGASFVRFTERSRAAAQLIRENLEHCHLESRAEIRRGDAFSFLESPPDERFDYCYIAPPQYKGLWARALRLLDESSGWLRDDSWVIAQIHPKEYEPLSLRALRPFDERKYGSTLLVFYETTR